MYKKFFLKVLMFLFGMSVFGVVDGEGAARLRGGQHLGVALRPRVELVDYPRRQVLLARREGHQPQVELPGAGQLGADA